MTGVNFTHPADIRKGSSYQIVELSPFFLVSIIPDYDVV